MKYAAIFLTALVLFGFQAQGPKVRPENWARPVINNELENWYQVDQKVYRSSQPGAVDMKTVEAFGIKEVLNLRDRHSDKDDARDTSLLLHRVETEADDLSEDQILEALKIIKNAKGPILVHCRYGADRTGAVIAAYRVIMQGWSKDDAIDEMVNGGFGFHKRYDNLIERIQNLDVDRIKRELQGL
ncbi:MAG: dual specificity protein phosphatase family protein [Thermodesulfobacteriota bacterium]